MKLTISSSKHPYHIVDSSPWPIMASFACFFFTLGTTMYLHGYNYGSLLTFIGFISILFVMYVWWRDVVREAVYEGQHTNQVQLGLRNGMLLFIISEIMFFFAFFWAFFHSALNPTPEIGCVWPPQGIPVIDPWGVPLLNTIILLSSGATLTWCHHAIVAGNFIESKKSFYLTISLAILFTCLQVLEYVEAGFTLSDGIYGSVFYLSTGFHGLHILIGSIFIIICLF